MNRIKRDYCSNGRHPRWRAWRSEYDMSAIKWVWLGAKCTYCGAPIRDAVGSYSKKGSIRRIK